MPEYFRLRLGPPVRHVAWVGHSMVSWATLNPHYQPIPNVRFTLYRKGGAKLLKFEEYPEFREALESRSDLAIVWLGGNDINPDTNITQIMNGYRRVKNLFAQQGIPVVFQTIEPRRYPPSHPAYMPLAQYNSIKNAINRHIQRTYYGNVIITGGRCFLPDELEDDGVHPTREARTRVERKIVGLVCQRFNLPSLQ